MVVVKPYVLTTMLLNYNFEAFDTSFNFKLNGIIEIFYVRRIMLIVRESVWGLRPVCGYSEFLNSRPRSVNHSCYYPEEARSSLTLGDPLDSKSHELYYSLKASTNL